MRGKLFIAGQYALPDDLIIDSGLYNNFCALAVRMTEIMAWHWRSAEKQLRHIEGVGEKSVNDVAIGLPAGVYTTLRTYGREKALGLRAHMDRLFSSAEIIRSVVKIDRGLIQRLMRVAINEFSFSDNLRLRIHIDMTTTPGDIYILVDPISLPSVDEKKHGVNVITREMHREQPLAKTTSFIAVAESLRKTIPEGINEVLMIGAGGELLEGLSSNFFAIKNRMIWTAEEGVLAGITRAIVIKTIEKLGLDLNHTAYPSEDIHHMTEAFLTSTSRGVLPIRTIDNFTIGESCPGPLTCAIRDSFDEQIVAELEEI
jgi:branched-chain amino acid aminotransferase